MPLGIKKSGEDETGAGLARDPGAAPSLGKTDMNRKPDENQIQM